MSLQVKNKVTEYKEGQEVFFIDWFIGGEQVPTKGKVVYNQDIGDCTECSIDVKGEIYDIPTQRVFLKLEDAIKDFEKNEKGWISDAEEKQRLEIQSAIAELKEIDNEEGS